MYHFRDSIFHGLGATYISTNLIFSRSRLARRTRVILVKSLALLKWPFVRVTSKCSPAPRISSPRISNFTSQFRSCPRVKKSSHYYCYLYCTVRTATPIFWYANTDKNQEKITNLEKWRKKLTALQRVFFIFEPTFALTWYNPWLKVEKCIPTLFQSPYCALYLASRKIKLLKLNWRLFSFRFSETQKRVKMSGPWAKEKAFHNKEPLLTESKWTMDR